MQKTLFRGFLMLLAVFFALAARAESAEKIFKFPSGLSFSYPSEYEATEGNLEGFVKYGVALMNTSDVYGSMRFTVAVMADPAENDIDEELVLRREMTKDLPPELQPKQLRQLDKCSR